MRYLTTFLVLAACTAPPAALDAGCKSYEEARVSMPRPLANTAEGRWIAILDARMTATCR